jgi:uncharacterized protein
MARWVWNWSDPLSDQQMQRVLQEEYGGMGEVLANLYGITGKEQYFRQAQRFDKKAFFDPLAAHRDELKGLHVNTHVPQVIAAARLYELTGEKRYWNIADYFWDEVTGERSYCTGGTSNFEHWRSEPGVLSTELRPLTAEDCCVYNMLKLTRHVFAWSPRASHMDYYERVLFNHRMGTIDPETGTTVYHLPHGNGYSKIYAKPFDFFWCCSGTGAEEFAKLPDTIYFHDDNSIFINLYIASDVNWTEKGIRVTQQTSFPEEQGTTLTISAARPVDVDLKLRVPYWAKNGSVKVNGRPISAFADPGSYLVLRGPWKNGDRIELSLPMYLHTRKLFRRRCTAPWYWPHASKKNRGRGGTGTLPRRRRKNVHPHCNSRAGSMTRRVGSNRRAESWHSGPFRKIKPWRLFLCRAFCMNGSPCTTRSMGAIPEGDHTPEEDIHDQFQILLPDDIGDKCCSGT